MCELFEGIFVPHVTPFKNDEEINEESLRGLVNYFIASGINGLVSLGSNGEFPYLSFAEKKRVLEIVIDEADGRVPVIAGTGASAIKEAIALTREARDIGADASLIVSPYYFKPSDEELYFYYSKIMEATDVSTIIYNVPKFTGYNIPIKIISRLADNYSQVIGVKDSSASIARISELIRLIGKRVSILAGTGDLIYPSLMLGAKGAVIAIANVAPKLCVDLYRAFQKNQLEEAKELQQKIIYMNEVLVQHYNQLSAIKEAMNMLRLNVGYPRKPTLPLEGEALQNIKSALNLISI